MRDASAIDAFATGTKRGLQAMKLGYQVGTLQSGAVKETYVASFQHSYTQAGIDDAAVTDPAFDKLAFDKLVQGLVVTKPSTPERVRNMCTPVVWRQII